MAKKTPKTYRVRVVNPSRPGAPRFMGESNPAKPRKVIASSKSRCHASPEEKRRYGGSTVTQFHVMYEGDERDASKWKEITGYGKTPGERKSDAIRKFREQQPAENPKTSKPKRTGNYVATFVPHDEEPTIIVRYIGSYSGGGDVTLEYESPEDAQDAWDGIRGDRDVELELAKQGFDEYGNDARARASRSRHETPRYNPKRSWNAMRTGVFRSYVDAHLLHVGPAYDWKYGKEIRWLAGEGLISGDDRRGYVITPAGIEEAKRRRMYAVTAASAAEARHNPEVTLSAEERSVLEDLRREAIDSEDDWGIDQGVRDFLISPTESPAAFLRSLSDDVDYHFGHSGEEGEGADPYYGRDSANRAHASIERARQRLAKRNPTRTDTSATPRANPAQVHVGATSARAQAMSRRIFGAGS